MTSLRFILNKIRPLNPKNADDPDGQNKNTPNYGVRYLDHNIPGHLSPGVVWGARICLENNGNYVWQRHHPEGKRVDLIVLIDDQIKATHNIPCAEVHPGEQITLYFPLHIPVEQGSHEILIDLVEQNVARFSDKGIQPLKIQLVADQNPLSLSAKTYLSASRINPWFYQPTCGIERSIAGQRFPLFVSRAKGCHIWDLEGRQYIDYIMGWGSSLLGYADDRVQQAIIDVIHSAAVTPFPHVFEMEVAQMLTEDFPSAEMVVFGKNGSDICTVAARLARLFTGKKTILFSGYHGWQDFWVEYEGFGKTGVPDRHARLIHRFNFNDLDDFIRLFELYQEDLAAVFIEPSGPGESIQGPEQDANKGFLSKIAALTSKTGALLIFDEIVTGYRYPSGSVQKATGVIPDLTCLGKAIASGMPLSALVGRADIFQRHMHNTHYGPTFKGEIYSFAAAKAAICIYRDEPVAESVWNYGLELKKGIDAICGQAGVAAKCLGPPFRMALTFDEPDDLRLRMKRTLYQQELLKSGVVTYNGIMLPSYAHNQEILALTLDAIGNALEKIAKAEQNNAFHDAIEIPLL